MPEYVVDPTRFQGEGAIVDWGALAKRLQIESAGRVVLAPTLELRWMLSPVLGLPTEPFKVWSRPHSSALQQALALSQMPLAYLFGFTVVTWLGGSMCHISVDTHAAVAGSIAVFAGAPTLENFVGMVPVPAGTATLELSGSTIDGVLVSPGVAVTAIRGIPSGALSQTAGWSLVEIVGLPVEQAAWNGIGRHGMPQGLVGALTDAPKAAVARLTRGGPPIGWGPLLTVGVSAPPWAAPNFPDLVKEVNVNLLDLLRPIVGGSPPNQQAAQTITVTLPPPKNSLGQSMSGAASNTTVAPLGMTFLGGSQDPFLSLVLGFGTAYVATRDGQASPAGVPFDYMITARWEKGLDGRGAPVEFAAIIPTPGAAFPPPPPANLGSELLGTLRPFQRDGDWRASVRVRWDRSPGLALFRTASFAAARASLAPAEPTAGLMETRPSGGFRPVGINQAGTPPDPEFWRLHVVDRELGIPSSLGTRSLKYAAAVQDIYGQWTPWVAADRLLTQPDLEPVRLISAKLRSTPPASGSVCATDLELEFIWDWRIRTPRVIRFAGSLYAAADHGSPPPSTTVPAGLDRSLGGGGSLLEVTFAGDVPTAPGTIIIGLSEGGDAQAAFGAAQGDETRRYRLTLPGVSLDFGSTGHIGLALWAQGQELIPPQRTTSWSEQPTVVTTSDPRPPVVPIEHVKLASLPDAAGEAHARISWTAQPGAAGYYVYESDETQILLANGLTEPPPDQTLDARLVSLKNAFNSNPSRREFTRRNANLITTTSTDIALPRGSTSIHVFIVIGVSAGQVESTWPSGPNAQDALVAIAAPHVMTPAPPLLEVQRYLDQAASPPAFKAKVHVSTRPGPRVKMIDLHRVRVEDAARDLDTMGPPVARVRTSGGGWNVATAVDSAGTSHIQSADGVDAPDGSWRRVWYRATAWTEKDDTRGALPGRSPASTAAWVVIPPDAGPVVSALQLGGGGAPPDVLLQWTSPAPLKRTPLGPHMLSGRAGLAGAPFGTPPLLSVDTSLDQTSRAAPGSGSGVWIFAEAPGLTTYRALVRRAAVSDTVLFSVRITDPLGRVGERLVTLGSGPIDPDPDVTDLAIQVVPPLPGPPRTMFTFASHAPLVAPLDGPYRVRVTVFPRGPRFPPRPPIVLEMPVGNVPKLPPLPSPPPGLYRSLGSGPKVTYVVVAPGVVSRFIVRVTAPDGRFAEKALP
jgi:hypothetical protein